MKGLSHTRHGRFILQSVHFNDAECGERHGMSPAQAAGNAVPLAPGNGLPLAT